MPSRAGTGLAVSPNPPRIGDAVSWASDPDEFVRRHLRVLPVAQVPEIQLHQAEEPIGLWLPRLFYQ